MKRIIPRDRSWMKSGLCMLAAVSVGMAAALLAKGENLAEKDAMLSAVYGHAIAETSELAESMSSDLNKLLVTGDAAEAARLLDSVSRSAQSVSGNLAALPIGAENVSATMKFVNQTGDAARAIALRFPDEGLTERQFDVLRILSGRAKAFSDAMNLLSSRWSAGEVVFSAEEFVADGSPDLYPLTETAAAYPTLLYDGPFSDSRGGTTYRGLEGETELTEEETRAALARYMEVSDDAVALSGESRIPVLSREYTVSRGGMVLSAAITAAGGQVLYLLPETEIGEPVLSAEECFSRAQAFAQERYGRVAASYYSMAEGVLTANFAAMAGDVILYPDLIKVQVSMVDGSVIGVEASGYLLNHGAREIGEPRITAEEAKTRLSPSLLPGEVRLCVIAVDTEEYLAWEVRGTGTDGDYLAYIDAEDGTERELFRLLYSDGGVLVI